MSDPRSIRLLRLAAAVVAVTTLEAQIGSGRQLAHEDDLRAALVLGFARFTEWPSLREGPLVIGVLGRPEMAVALKKLAAGKVVNARPVTIRRLKQPGQAAGCHVVYFGRLPGGSLPEAIAEVQGEVLTIGEDDRFLSAGGAVQLFEEDGRMSFEANLSTLQSANLSISSKLLRLGYTTGAARRGKAVR